MDQAKKIILIAEDTRIVRVMVVKVLEKYLPGFSIVAKENGKEALDFFIENKDRIALIFTDFDMPEMNGVELSQRIWEIDPNVGIILTTSHREDSDLLKGAKVTSYLGKTYVSVEPLVDAIVQVLTIKGHM
jgi:CheY-like chemotaxis protein